MAASQLTESQIAEFTAAFKSFDRDGDNNINAADLTAALKSLGITLTETETTAWLNEADTTGKGLVSFTAFMTLAGRNFRDIIAEEEMKEAFKIFDKNGDGFVTNDELKFAMAQQGDNLSDEEIAEIIREMDVDGDGKLNFEEFAKMMTPPKH
ncbi:UNVERIFIED_CONTAM: calmodulin-like 3 [Siphonaria sp. JEL0065]|nr:calmodulin-like 3 [Siphonaria sp. JEL0065]